MQDHPLILKPPDPQHFTAFRAISLLEGGDYLQTHEQVVQNVKFPSMRESRLPLRGQVASGSLLSPSCNKALDDDAPPPSSLPQEAQQVRTLQSELPSSLRGSYYLTVPAWHPAETGLVFNPRRPQRFLYAAAHDAGCVEHHAIRRSGASHRAKTGRISCRSRQLNAPLD